MEDLVKGQMRRKEEQPSVRSDRMILNPENLEGSRERQRKVGLGGKGFAR